MKPVDAAKATVVIRDTWGEGSLHERVLHILLRRLRPADVDLLPLHHLRKLCEGQAPNKDLDDAFRWFASPAIGLLEAAFEFFADDGSEYILTARDVSDALSNGSLVTPDGRVWKDFARNAFLFYRATDDFKSMLAAEVRA